MQHYTRRDNVAKKLDFEIAELGIIVDEEKTSQLGQLKYDEELCQERFWTRRTGKL